MVFRLIAARTFKCFTVNCNHLILLAIPPLQRSHSARHRVPRAAEGHTGCGWRGGMRPHYTPCLAADLCTAAAAVRITSSTCLGWESIGTWLLFISTVVAPMRFAANFITRPHFGSGEKCALTIFQSRPRLA